MPQFKTLRLSSQSASTTALATAMLLQGHLVAFPTDTVYGLGAHAFQAEAVGKLYAVKERPAHLPIPLLLPDAEAMRLVCASVPTLAWELAQRFWPGGLSLVLPRSVAVPDVVTAGGASVAVRVPDHPLVRELCLSLGAPLAATSANVHGQPAPVTADAVEKALAGRILLLDGGPCPGGIASTVLDLGVSPPVILRRGPVTAGELAEVVPLAQGSTS
jgi:L-threonylcarbamoyladenylate synthase